MGGDYKYMQNLAGRPEGKRVLSITIHTYGDNIEQNFKQTGYGLDQTGSG
jgi:hypothetical protein